MTIRDETSDKIRDVVTFSIVVSLLAPCVTPHGLVFDRLPKPWVVQLVTASSTLAVAKTNDLISGRQLTTVERNYRHSTILPST